MAPPPKYLITRKLIRRFFDNYLPKEPLLAAEESNKLMDCWGKYGVDSPKCKEFELLYDYVQDQTEKYRQRLRGINYPAYVLKLLQKPKYPNLTKGRYKSPKTIPTDDFFRGIR